MPEGQPKQLRTVGLRDALVRVRSFVTSSASADDLASLVDIRDGVVHAGAGGEILDRVFFAFVVHTDAMLKDLGKTRPSFWDDRLALVDALLADATDKTAHRVVVKLETARANFSRRYGGSSEVIQFLIGESGNQFPSYGEETARCPACECEGKAEGDYEVREVVDRKGIPEGSEVVFLPADFKCSICGLWLDSIFEIEASPLEDEWVLDGADPDDYAAAYEHGDPDLAYDLMREEVDDLMREEGDST